MTKEEMLVGNKLIAEFMEYKYKNSSKFWCKYPLDDNSFLSKLGEVQSNNFKFHSSWDWLIPVVEKIEKLSYNTKKGTSSIEVLIYDDRCSIQYEGYYSGSIVNELEGYSKIEAVYEAVIEFIKYYNKNEWIRKIHKSKK